MLLFTAQLLPLAVAVQSIYVSNFNTNYRHSHQHHGRTMIRIFPRWMYAPCAGRRTLTPCRV